MKRSIAVLLDEAKGKMSGYVALTNYRFMNLCVDAEPAALLCVTIELGGTEFKIEELVDVASPREDQFALLPKENDPELIFAICKGVEMSHPEFKMEVKDLDDEEGGPVEEREKYILLTMPEVDDARHDLIISGVDSLTKACEGKLDFLLDDYTQKMTLKLTGAKEEEIKEATDAIKDLHDKHKEMLDGYVENKKNQVEEAYQRWQEKQQEGDDPQQEEDKAAHDPEKAMKMNLDDMEGNVF
ncbi:MAG: ribosome recycling factor [Bacteroidales bacterium]|nr:ribosome recycling factor [Bacteroidales bacterium]